MPKGSLHPKEMGARQSEKENQRRFTHANHALHPVQERIRIAALRRHVYVFEAIRPVLDDR